MNTQESEKSGQEVAKHGPGATRSRYHEAYWKSRLYRKSFTRGGETQAVQELSVRLQHLGRREAFALGTANAAAGASKAKDIAGYLEANGWALTLAKFKPGVLAKLQVATVGEFLAEAQGFFQPRTGRIYATKLRKIISDICDVGAGTTGKAKRQKFDYVNGGHAAWLATIDSQSLNVLSPEAVRAWRNTYVANAGPDPMKRKSAERSAASMLRAGRALFSPDVVNSLKVKVPPNPFAGVKLEDPGPQRYRSKTNPEWLLACAGRDLREKHPQQYLALFLCLWAGLRRKEADLLTWAQIDLAEGELHVRRTAYFEPKTDESERTIDLAPEAVDVLRSFKDGAIGEFVLAGGDADPAASYGYYRADGTWRDLIAWLKGKGVGERNAIHMLRKESGSLVASSHGIEAARQHLGHRDIRTTSSHYVDKKKRVEVRIDLGGAQLKQA